MDLRRFKLEFMSEEVISRVLRFFFFLKKGRCWFVLGVRVSQLY